MNFHNKEELLSLFNINGHEDLKKCAEVFVIFKVSAVKVSND